MTSVGASTPGRPSRRNLVQQQKKLQLDATIRLPPEAFRNVTSKPKAPGHARQCEASASTGWGRGSQGCRRLQGLP